MYLLHKLVQVNNFYVKKFCHFAQNQNFLTTKNSQITVYSIIITHADANSAVISTITVVVKSACVASYHLQILDNTWLHT